MVKIMTWNTTSLVKITRRMDLEERMAKEKADIVLIQETRLREAHRLRLPGMRIERNDEGVGTMVAIAEKYRVERVELENVEFDHTAVLVKAGGGEVLVVSIYIKFNMRKEDLESNLKRLEEAIDKFERVVIGGDLNARNDEWNEKAKLGTNGNGRVIQRWLEENRQLRLISPEEPTFRDKSILDHYIVTSRLERHATIKVEQGGLDHHVVLLEMVLKLEKERMDERKSVSDEKKINWVVFRSIMTEEMASRGQKTRSNMTKEQIDEAVKETAKAVSVAKERCLPKMDARTGRRKETPEEIRMLYGERRAAKRELGKIGRRNEVWAEALKELIRKRTVEIVKAWKEEANTRTKEMLERVDRSKDTLKVINRMNGRRNRWADCKLENEGRIVTKKEDIAELFSAKYDQ